MGHYFDVVGTFTRLYLPALSFGIFVLFASVCFVVLNHVTFLGFSSGAWWSSHSMHKVLGSVPSTHKTQPTIAFLQKPSFFPLCLGPTHMNPKPRIYSCSHTLASLLRVFPTPGIPHSACVPGLSGGACLSLGNLGLLNGIVQGSLSWW